jgi:hypothetical protein
VSDDLPRSEIALAVLKDVRGVLDEWAGSDWSHTRPVQEIDHLLHLAYARIRMAGMARDRRPARWLAKVGSFSFPRFAPGDKKRKIPETICFEIEVTDGSKAVRDRRIEVRMTPEEAARFGAQVASMAAMYPGVKVPVEEDPLAGLLPNEGEG